MNWWQYLLLVNVYLLLFYGFYALLLRSETFFRLNRAYLTGSVVMAFVIPVIQADWLRGLFITRQINQTIYLLDVVNIGASPKQVNHALSIGQLLVIAYLSGVTIFLIRFVIRILKLAYAIRNTGTNNAFSFFGKINIGDEVPEIEIVTAHEEVHARQWHSADILLIELITVINWFNPVIYLYRKAVKHIHEFIADHEIINQGTGKQDYAMLLLSQTVEAPIHQLANSFFNHSLLKQRIMMLHKNPSQRKALLKYGLCAPLFALMVILSSATAKTNALVNKVSKKADHLLNTEPSKLFNSTLAHADDIQSRPLPKLIKTQSENKIKSAKDYEKTLADTTKDPVFTSVQETAQPAGGMSAFYMFLGQNIHYPMIAHDKNIQGMVICQFIVEKSGSLSDLKVIRGIGGGCDEEALRVLSMSPKWTPCMKNGKVVRQQFTIPISFSISPDSQTKTNTTITSVPLYPINTTAPVQVTSFKTVHYNTDTTGTNGSNVGGSKNPDYYINGVLATSDAWHNIHPKDILSIDVKGPTPSHPDAKKEVWIKTKN